MRRTTTTLTRLSIYACSPLSKPKLNPNIRGQNLNAARELVPETSASLSAPNSLLDVCPGLPGCGTEVVVSRTTLRRRSDQEERMQTVKEMDMRTRLTEEYETVNRTEEPYGRKEGVKDDLRYGCMEKYKRDSS
jgi:hypothetical protein